MSVFSNAPIAAGESSTAQVPAILDKNWQTTAAVGLGVASGGLTGAIMLAAFPAQTLATGAAIGGLAVAGHRRANGEDPTFGLAARFSKKSDEATEPAAEAVPAAA